eukprot:gene10803-3421_t
MSYKATSSFRIEKHPNQKLASGEMWYFSPPVIHLNIFHCWLNGDGDEKTAKKIKENIIKENRKLNQKNYIESFKSNDDLLFDFVFNQVQTQFRIFEKLRNLLMNPSEFLNQGYSCLLPIAPSVKNEMIERYFSFDEEVVREFIGKKMTVKLRKELENINEKTKLNLISIKRQFDNFYFIFKIIKEKYQLNEKKEIISLKEIIQLEFFLSSELSEKYSRIIFLCFHQFETFKKKLKDLTFTEIDLFSELMLKYWTIPTFDPLKIQLDFNILRDFKNLLSTNDFKEEIKLIIQDDLRKNKLSDKKIDYLMNKLPLLLKNLISIGSGLVLSKEIQDLFIDIFDKFIDPISKLKLDLFEFDIFTKSILNSYSKIKLKDQSCISTWEDYFFVISKISFILYQKL